MEGSFFVGLTQRTYRSENIYFNRNIFFVRFAVAQRIVSPYRINLAIQKEYLIVYEIRFELVCVCVYDVLVIIVCFATY